MLLHSNIIQIFNTNFALPKNEKPIVYVYILPVSVVNK